MPIATGLAIGLGVASAAGSLGGAAIAAHGAGQAAKTQLGYENNALDFQKQQYADSVKRSQPWVNAGTTAINQLSGDMTNGTFAPWNKTFQAPTDVTEQNDPGFQARLKMGQDALENSAAAKGTLLSGGTAKALTQYGQDFGSNEYQNVYNRALDQYQQSYNEFQNNQSNQFNRLATLSGIGQTATTNLNTQGTQTGQQVGNTLSNEGAIAGSGIAGQANAWGGAISNIANLPIGIAALRGSGYSMPPPTQANGGIS